MSLGVCVCFAVHSRLYVCEAVCLADSFFRFCMRVSVCRSLFSYVCVQRVQLVTFRTNLIVPLVDTHTHKWTHSHNWPQALLYVSVILASVRPCNLFPFAFYI